MRTVVFLTTHLSGTGHFVRSLALARAVEAMGGRAVLITGGRPLAHIDAGGIEIVEIAPLSVRDLDFSTLRDAAGTPVGPDYLLARRLEIEALIADTRPDALVTELFPLGRRRLAAEFQAAIAAARAANPQAAVIASVRDVPEPPKKAARLDEAAERLARHYDALLVHGDAAVLPLAASWPLPESVARMIRHTGYVGTKSLSAEPPGEAVLVAGGGGALGDRLARIAAESAALSARPWHILTGGAEAAATAAALTAVHGRDGLIIEPARPDYRALLARAAVSVSLAGYNTLMDLAACTTPGLLVPFSGAGEREQTIRAAAFARFPGASVLAEATLAPAALAEAAERMAAGPRRAPWPLALDGAPRAAAEIARIVDAKRVQ